MKKLILIILILLTSVAFAQKKEKTYKLLAACGTCNWSMASETGCELAVQIAGKNYWVDGSKLQDHGDEHDPESGMCRNVRKAEVVGRIEDGRMKATSFVLIDNKQKKKK